MKKYYLLATALAAMVSCTSDDYVGDNNLQEANGQAAISFNSGVGAITRADKTGVDAATDLANNFVVFGYKTMSNDEKQTVFPNYQVNYANNTQNSTTTNSANWEYVGYTSLSANMTGNTGVAGNATGVNNEQTIKYWDYSAASYKFYAYSLGAGKTGSPKTYANATLMTTSDTYQLSGDKDQLATCYISDLLTIADPNGTTSKQVSLNFQSIQSKLQLGFYETIPGYSVKELKFYTTSGAASSVATPALYASSATLPNAGTYTITFDSNGKPLLAWAGTGDQNTNVVFSATLSDYAAADYQETEGTIYLGRASNEATKTEEIKVLPYANGADLTLKVDYILVSRDGSGETIEAKGATAKVPAAYTQWKPNYKYTYLFKISDKTNPLIGEVVGLYPITLDAVVLDDAIGNQETITTVTEPSITTYAKASNVTTDNEYLAGSNIYVVVEDGETNPTLTVGTNAKLYTVTLESGAAQEITEASVANALINGNHNTTEKTWTVTDALGKAMVVKDTESDLLTALNAIPNTDSPTGVALTINCAKFTPDETYAKVTSGTSLTAGKKYYTSNTGTGEFTAGAAATADDSTYEKVTGYYVFEYTKPAVSETPATKHYKVIKVQ